MALNFFFFKRSKLWNGKAFTISSKNIYFKQYIALFLQWDLAGWYLPTHFHLYCDQESFLTLALFSICFLLSLLPHCCLRELYVILMYPPWKAAGSSEGNTGSSILSEKCAAVFLVRVLQRNCIYTHIYMTNYIYIYIYIILHNCMCIKYICNFNEF